jgi:hypothetical protein
MAENESDARYHARRIRDMLQGVMQHMREDIGKVDDPSAKALFETSAETLGGLIKAYEDFEKKAEPAWQR